MPLTPLPCTNPVLPVPFDPLGRGVPLCGELAAFIGGRLEGSRCDPLKGVHALVLADGEQLQVCQFVVEVVTIDMMDLMPMRNLSVSIFPNRPMQVRRPL